MGRGRQKGQTKIEMDEVSELFNISLEAMQMRGKASLGDKTVLDVLAAARDAAKNQTDWNTMHNSINKAINEININDKYFIFKSPE